EIEAVGDMTLRGFRVELPVRHPADEIGPLLHRRFEELGRAGVALDPFLREGDDLDLAQVGVIRPRLQDALQRPEAADRVNVDMAAEGGDAGEYRAADHLSGAFRDLLDPRGGLRPVQELDRLRKRPDPVRWK